jgi:hypothetical protein
VRLRWLDHRIASGDVEGAGNAVKQLMSDQYLPDGMRKMAVAYAKSGDGAKAVQHFALAIDAAAQLKDFDCAKSMWQTADAQLALK